MNAASPAQHAPATLQVRDLRTHFHTRAGVLPAVDGVSFTLERGKILGLVGESGSGKSVTGFSIMGLVDPPGRIVGGEVLFQGRDLAKLPARELRKLQGNRIAMIFQDPMMTLNPVLRVDVQMIETVLAHSKMSRSQARELARDTLGMMGIPSPEERLRAYPHQLSGGMQQRTAIARALAYNPQVLLMDEPFAALDAMTRDEMQRQLTEIWERTRKTVVYITHNVGEAVFLADKIMVMSSKGEITAMIDNDIPRPRDPLGASFIELQRQVLAHLTH